MKIYKDYIFPHKDWKDRAIYGRLKNYNVKWFKCDRYSPVFKEEKTYVYSSLYRLLRDQFLILPVRHFIYKHK